MNPQIFNRLILLLCCLFFTHCSPEDEVLSSLVQFEASVLQIEENTPLPFSVPLSISPPAVVESEIVIAISTLGAMEISTDPEENGLIRLPVASGQTSVTFSVTEIVGNSDVGSVEFEVIDVGVGLVANELDGRFLNFEVFPTEEIFVFQEDFSNCTSENIPNGWSEVVVQQNMEGSAVWSCTGEPSVEINAFVGGSSDQTPSEVWLISPLIDLSITNNTSLRFEVDRRFEPDSPGLIPFDVRIATNLTEESFETADWQSFEPAVDFIFANDPGSDDFTESDKLDLSAFNGETIHIAFIYRAGAVNTSEATILRVRDFEIVAN
ncbi:MAG: choice-of-anchor J domain-containing protein [Bacteroidota bacterium]